VRRGGGFQALNKYLEEIHYPILAARFGPETALQFLVRPPTECLSVL
jgi:hypothetical protein